MKWDWEFTLNEVLPRLADVVHVTIEATVLSFILAAVLGLGLMLVRNSKNQWIARPTAELIEFIRGTPIIVQLFFVFFVLPDIGIFIPPLTSGIIVLGIHNSAYCSEVYRAGLYGVARGQWEAAYALNLSTYRMYRDIIIPQAILPVAPALGNYLIGIFKETPLLSLIAVVEILHEAKQIGSETFRFLEPMTVAGVFFFIMSIIAALLVSAAERQLRQRILHR